MVCPHFPNVLCLLCHRLCKMGSETEQKFVKTTTKITRKCWRGVFFFALLYPSVKFLAVDLLQAFSDVM